MKVSESSSFPEDEIDFRSLGRRILSALSYPFRLWLKNPLTTLLFILAALAFALFIRFNSVKTYRSSFIIRPNDRTERFHLKILDDIRTLVKQQNRAVIASELGISEADASSLRNLECVYPAIKFSRDTVHCTEIFLETNDYTRFLTLQKSLLNYLETNPYFAQIYAIQQRQIEAETKQVEADLTKLDSLKIKQLQSYDAPKRSPESNLLLSELVNPASTYTVANERFNKKMQLIARSYYMHNFQLVKSCPPFQKPYWPPRLLVLCLVLVPVFLVVSFVFLAIRDIRRQPSQTKP